MVAVVQLVEHQVVILGVAGSSPVSHPNAKARTVSVRAFAFPQLEHSDSARFAYRDTSTPEEHTNRYTPVQLYGSDLEALFHASDTGDVADPNIRKCRVLDIRS